MNDYSLLVSFPDGSQPFVSGFEAGMIWMQLRDKSIPEKLTVNSENREVIQRMCDASFYDVSFEESGVEGWLYASFKPKKSTLSLVSKS